MTKETKGFDFKEYIKDKNFSKEEMKTLENMLGILNTEDDLLTREIKKQLTDTYSIIYDATCSVGVYKVYDVIGNIIARAWLDPEDKEKVIIVKNIFSKRMN